MKTSMNLRVSIQNCPDLKKQKLISVYFEQMLHTHLVLNVEPQNCRIDYMRISRPSVFQHPIPPLNLSSHSVSIWSSSGDTSPSHIAGCRTTTRRSFFASDLYRSNRLL